VRTIASYGLLGLSCFLAGAFAHDDNWFGATVMALAAGVIFDNIKIQRSKVAAIAQKENG
jgi:hypothetical protein